jgi:predicted phage tail protein
LNSAAAPNGSYYVSVRAVYASGTRAPSNEILLQVGCTAPAPQPTALRVQLTGATVTLTWVPPSGAVERQVIEAGSATGLTNLASVTLPPTQSSFTATAPNGTYFVRARAANSCGTSAPSSEVFFTVGAGVALPGAPTGLVGNVTGRDVSLSWMAPTAPVTGYLLEYGSGAGLTRASIPLGSETVFAANDVPVGTFYLRVRAVNAAGVGPPTADVVLVVQ